MSGDGRARSIVLGVAGGSGAGKSTVVHEVVRRLGGRRTVVIHHDAYYRDLSPLGPAERAAVNFDHPDSLETDLLVAHLERLLRGSSVRLPVYDFTTHTRVPDPGGPVTAKPILILEGILVLAEPRLRELMDLRVFVDTEPDVRLARRIRRDIARRGRTVADVLDQYEESVRPMHLEIVEPSKTYADLVVPGSGDASVAADPVVAALEALLDQVDNEDLGGH